MNTTTTRTATAATRLLAAAALLASAGVAASADTATLQIDSSQSSIQVDATLMTVIGDETDSASTSISGSIEIELDDYGNPTQISIIDYTIVLDNDVTLNFNFGFAGSASAVLRDAMAMDANPGLPTGPVPITADMFDFAAVPTVLSGTADSSYNFLFVGSGSESLDLADQGVIDAPIMGEVIADPDSQTVTISGAFAIDTTQTAVPDIADIQLVGTATLVAFGDAPMAKNCNAADLEPPFGVLDLQDIQTFIDAFQLALPAADIAEPFGVYDLNDLGLFVSTFLAGCP